MFNPARYKTLNSNGPERLREVRNDFRKIGLDNNVDDGLGQYRTKMEGIKFVEEFISDNREMYKGEEWIRFCDEYRATVAAFMSNPINRRWHEITRAFENPEAFLDNVTLEMVDLRIDRQSSSFSVHRYNWHQIDDEPGTSYLFISCFRELDLEELRVFDLFTDRAIDVIMAVSALLVKNTTTVQQCCKIYYNDDEGYTIGDDRHPLFKSPECQSFYCETINPNF